ncbi:MAG: outer membrane protein assembly factor BamA [Candidatus Omnitrophica bacterium]|nr:outer membrane protein assembly factor BamA [Candidatus Omnitrophota bacterium]
MNKKLLVFIFILLLSLPVFAQEATQTGEVNPAKDSAVKMVTAIEVKGNKSISSNTILSKMKTRQGNPYQDNIISDDLKRLYILGYFSDIKINTEPYKDGLKVVILVEERPLIDKITLSGTKISQDETKKIKDAIKTKEGQYLDYPALSDDVEAIKKMYEKKGYSQAEVENKPEVDSVANKAKVEFKILQGKRQAIKAIYVEGNLNFSDARILKIIKTKRAWLFNSGVLKEEVLTEDMERIKTFYHKAGFIDVAVSFEAKSDPLARYIYVTVKVEEGKKYLVGSLAIRGNKDISETDIISSIKICTPGKIFSHEALKEDISKVQGLYFDRGYILAQVDSTTSLNSDTGRIDIVLNIVENQVVYVDKIKIRGNVKTKDVVIRRELRIKPGDRFDGEKLRRSKERLQNLGYFEEISYDTEDTGSQTAKDLVVDVKEAKTGAFSFGGGYSSVDQVVGFVEVEQKNFDWKNWPYFTGAGQDLKLRASAGSLSNGLELSYTEPWLWDYPVSFGFDLYSRNHKRDSDVGYGYDEKVTGGDIRLGKEISEYWKTGLTYRYDQIKITNITEDASSELQDEYGTNTISSVDYELTYDSRDNVFIPSRGDVFSNSVMIAGGPLSGDKDFWKYTGRAEHYTPLFRESVLELAGRVSVADTYSDTQKIPIYERFFAGGAYTVRGYRERKIGPIDPSSGDPLGGNSMIIGNLEYTYPLISFLRLAAFYDVGNVWAKTNDIGSGGFKSGTGVGFRLKTPIGPIMLDYGIPLNKETGESKRGGGRFHFSMSHGF